MHQLKIVQKLIKTNFMMTYKDAFNRNPNHDIKVLMGDMNSKINSDKTGMEQISGTHGSAQETIDNGEHLLLFCSINSLAVSSSFFSHKDIHKKTWRSRDGKIRNEIDYVCISQRWKSSVKDVRVCRGAYSGSDHHVVLAMMRLRLKKLKRIGNLLLRN